MAEEKKINAELNDDELNEAAGGVTIDTLAEKSARIANKLVTKVKRAADVTKAADTTKKPTKH
jgi:hypothetical protein